MSAEHEHSDAERNRAEGAPAPLPVRRRRRLAVSVSEAWSVTWGSTLGDLVAERVKSPRSLYGVLSYIAAWGAFYDVMGRGPVSNRELAQTVGKGPRTVDVWRNRYDEAFPDFGTPELLWLRIRPEVGPVDDLDVAPYRLGGVHV